MAVSVLSPSPSREILKSKRWSRKVEWSQKYHRLVGLEDMPSVERLKYIEAILHTNVDPQMVYLSDFGSAPGVDLDSAEKEKTIADLQRENSELCHVIEQRAPHKQVLRIALTFLLFFSGTLTFQWFSGISLISSGLDWAVVAVSASAVLLSYLAALDLRDWKSRENSSH